MHIKINVTVRRDSFYSFKDPAGDTEAQLDFPDGNVSDLDISAIVKGLLPVAIHKLQAEEIKKEPE